MASHLNLDPLSGPAPAKYRGRNPFWRFRRLFYVLAVIAGIGLGMVWYIASQVELTQDDFDTLIATSYVCTAEVATGCSPENATNEISLGGEDRVFVPYDQIPDVMIAAVVATEDKNYFGHNGVAPMGLARAGYQGAKQKVFGSSGSLQGGSTITQQYIKLTTEDNSRTYTRKAREIVRAIKFEQALTEQFLAQIEAEGIVPPEGMTVEDLAKQMTKEEILERYLNRVWFGRRAYGVEAASLNYFKKSVSELTLPEAAYLAGLIRNPPVADYASSPEEADRRRTATLIRMADDHYITADQRDTAIADPWTSFAIHPPSKGLGDVKGSEYGTDYFVTTVRKRLEEIYPEGDFYRSGIRVYTTLDPRLQQLAHQTITGRLDPTNPFMPLGALVSLDDQNRVVAMMGGTNWNGSNNNPAPQVNLATGSDGGGVGFQPGSTMKPIVLAEFIEQGYSPKSYYDRSSVTINGNEFVGRDKADPTYRTVLDATTYSSNIVYVKMGQTVGNDNVVEMAHKLGVVSELQPVDSLPLGPEVVSPLEMATVYSTFLHEGVQRDPVFIDRIEDAKGNVLCWYPVAGTDCTGANPNANKDRVGTPAIDPSIARQVNYAMGTVVERGTGKAAKLVAEDGTVRATAGKTGTTNDYKDAWFTGFTCNLTTSVWMGYPDPPEPDKNYPVRDGVEMTPEEYETMRAGLSGSDLEKEANNIGWRMSDAAEPRSSDLFGGDYPKIEGGKIPAEMWREYMLAATANDAPCDSLPMEEPNASLRIIGSELTTTLPPCLPPPTQPNPDNGGNNNGNGGNGNGNGGNDNGNGNGNGNGGNGNDGNGNGRGRGRNNGGNDDALAPLGGVGGNGFSALDGSGRSLDAHQQARLAAVWNNIQTAQDGGDNVTSTTAPCDPDGTWSAPPTTAPTEPENPDSTDNPDATIDPNEPTTVDPPGTDPAGPTTEIPVITLPPDTDDPIIEPPPPTDQPIVTVPVDPPPPTETLPPLPPETFPPPGP